MIRELDYGADECSLITHLDSAIRTAGMIDYVSTYYLPSGGDHAAPDTQRRLQNARCELGSQRSV